MIKDFYKILFCMIMLMFSYPLSTYSEIVEQIEIKGNKRIPNETIKMFSSVSVNDDINTEKINSLLPPLNEFILPGGSEFTARIHIARSECRDAERVLIALSENEYVPDIHKKYINRLSDFFFVLSRIENFQKGQKEIGWNYK